MICVTNCAVKNKTLKFNVAFAAEGLLAQVLSRGKDLRRFVNTLSISVMEPRTLEQRQFFSPTTPCFCPLIAFVCRRRRRHWLKMKKLELSRSHLLALRS